jgi:hypothetical protein
MVKTLNTSNVCPYCRFKINDKPINNRFEINIDEYNEDDEDNDDDYADDDDYTDDDDYDDDDDNEDENENNENNNIATNVNFPEGNQESEESDEECNIKYFESYFKANGISYLNLLSVLFNRYPQDMTGRMKRKLEENVYNMGYFLDEEHMKKRKELDMMLQNDVNVNI